MPNESESLLRRAVEAFQEGKMHSAETACRDALAADERCAGAWHLLGRMAALNGDLELAGDFAGVACELEPGNAVFLRGLGEVFLNRGELEMAETHARRALEILPEDADSLALLGRILSEKGEKADSLSAFQQALRLRKDDAEICAHYARALQKMGRGKDAISQMRKAVTLAPESVEYCTSLGMLLEENKRYADALAAYDKAVRLGPDVGFTWYRKGKLLGRMGRYGDGLLDLERALSLAGEVLDCHYEYGLALLMSKRTQEALVAFDRAIALGLDTAALHCNRGVILKEFNRYGEAVQSFHRAVTLDPANVHYINNLGAVALEVGLNSEALECFKDAVERNPNLQTAHNNIGNLLKDRAKGGEALAYYRRSMELAVGDHGQSRQTKSNYLLCLQYLPDMEPAKVFEEHKKWGLESAKLLRPAFNHTSRRIPAGQKIRIGILSPDLCQHPVGVFMEPFLAHYDRAEFEVFAYADYKQGDKVSERLRGMVDMWRETASLGDGALAKQIHSDGVDVLFELSGHTALNRLDVFALKPAPLQVAYLGYPSTTGLPTIDFRLTDAEADVPGRTAHLHTERLVRLRDCAWCYMPHPLASPLVPLPALANGVVTFACFNNMAKWNESLYGMWVEILHRVPGARLRLKARTLLDRLVCKELESFFVDRGIARERLEFSGHAKGIAAHLAEYNRADIALDSFPYHGTTTTCEALWMGLPVVTLEGGSHVSRVGVSLLRTVGLGAGVASTREEYIAKSVALAGDLEALAALRAGMRERMMASPLMDGPGYARRFEDAVREMVKGFRAPR